MNREIKFRGKRLGSGEWVYGDLLTTHGIDENGTAYTRYEIRGFKPNFGPVYFTVDGNTVGQYTGLKDKNGKEIYEGDIINITEENYSGGIIDFNVEAMYNAKLGAFTARNFDYPEDDQTLLVEYTTGTVIGNIHDNPELMKTVDD